jgi:hypothetical protein
MSEQGKNNYLMGLRESFDQDLEAFKIASLSMYESETLAAVTDGTDGTYYYYVDMAGYKQLGLQLIIGAGSGSVTVTVEGTTQDDGTAQASCTYIDVTNGIYGAANFTASAALYDSDRKCGNFKYLRVKVVANTGGADDGDWTIFSKKLF